MPSFMDAITRMSGSSGEMHIQYILYSDASKIVYANTKTNSVDVLSGEQLVELSKNNIEAYQEIVASLRPAEGSVPFRWSAMVPGNGMYVLAAISQGDITLSKVDLSTLKDTYFMDEDCTVPISTDKLSEPVQVYKLSAIRSMVAKEGSVDDLISAASSNTCGAVSANGIELTVGGAEKIFKANSPAHITTKMIGPTLGMVAPKINANTLELNLRIRSDMPLTIIPTLRTRVHGFSVCRKKVGNTTRCVASETFSDVNDKYVYEFYAYSRLTGIYICKDLIGSIIAADPELSNAMSNFVGDAVDFVKSIVKSDVCTQTVVQVYGSLIRHIGLVPLTIDSKSGVLIALTPENKQVLVHAGIHSDLSGGSCIKTKSYGNQFAEFIPVPGTCFGLIVYGIPNISSMTTEYEYLDPAIISLAKQQQAYMLQSLMLTVDTADNSAKQNIQRYLQSKGITQLDGNVIS